MSLMLYSAATAIASPFIPLYLRLREKRGKEEGARRKERLGHASIERPEGRLLWIHAASVGEANAALPLIEALKKTVPDWKILLTTGTVTSAALMRKSLPAGVIHQYVPVDTPGAARRFVTHWKPEMVLFIESELWPNLLREAHMVGARMVLVNARMSDKSFRSWSRMRGLASMMLGWFHAIYAQTEQDAERFSKLGAGTVECLGNLKYDNDPLAVDAEMLVALQHQTEGRILWLAASTHPGEESAIAEMHALLVKQFSGLLSVIVPRHPQRGGEIREEITKENPELKVVLRSESDEISASCNIYIADTLGELGLFYRLCPVVFMGGSLVPHGGQNPLEPARLGCTLLFGPHMFNFSEIAAGLKESGGAVEVADRFELARQLSTLLKDPSQSANMAAKASAWVIGKSGVSQKLMSRILPYMRQGVSHAA